MLLPRIRKQVYDRLLTPFSRISNLSLDGNSTGKIAGKQLESLDFIKHPHYGCGIFRRVGRTETLCARAAKMLACFPACYHSDGGCDEGPSYWGKAAGSLFDCCELLYDLTGGAFSLFDDPLLRPWENTFKKRISATDTS